MVGLSADTHALGAITNNHMLHLVLSLQLEQILRAEIVSEEDEMMLWFGHCKEKSHPERDGSFWCHL